MILKSLNEIDADETGIASGYSLRTASDIWSRGKTIDRLAEELCIGREKAVMLEHMIHSSLRAGLHGVRKTSFP